MESPNPDSSTGAKRKRTPIPESAPTPTIHAAGHTTPINYLVRAKGEKLSLIEGGPETFGDVLSTIDDYEGVLQRHESLAANLGAKLVGPLLLKSFEKLFDGPIKVIQTSFALEQSPVSWLDIVTFARSNPSELLLTDSTPSVRCCRFWIKGGQVEISEDDYRLIMSGGPERMIPTQPLAEDESAELGTLNILEARLAILIKKADAVASKARQLNYHLKGRKTALLSRKAAEQPAAEKPPERKFSPQPFVPVNQQQLLEQFHTTSPSSSSRRASITTPRPKHSRVHNSNEPLPNFNTFNNSSAQEADRRLSQPLSAVSEDNGAEGQYYRVLMASKIEKLAKGDAIFPPCDRCRRLNFECSKHLTACTACTKKHAKCSWKDVKEGEVDFIPHPHSAPLPQPQSSTRASSENASGNGNGGGNGGAPYISIEAPSQQFIDPGLRNVPPGIPTSMALTVEQRERENRLSNEHAMLTQIASAAAAAGNR